MVTIYVPKGIATALAARRSGDWRSHLGLDTPEARVDDRRRSVSHSSIRGDQAVWGHLPHILI